MTRTIFAALFAMGMLLGMAAMASAAAISCGDCHSNPPVDTDNCTDNAKELHGTHVNYSSASFADVDDKCAYCHVAVAGTAPTATHNDNTVDIASTKAGSLSYDEPSRTCTDACHANNANTAKWGNYTAVVSENIKLTCDSCHDDASDNTGLSVAHGVHLLTNVSTNTTLTSGVGNGKCDACHPDNVNDLWSGGMADDGSKKVYPHASDGTNVSASNVSVDGGIGYTGTNCTNACHNNDTTEVWTDTALSCDACHDDTGTAGLLGRHSQHITGAGATCSDCHSVPSAGDTSHAYALPVASDNATVSPGSGTFNDGPNTCSNTGAACHGATGTTASWYSTGNSGCAGCHNYPDGNNWSANNGHAVQYDTGTVVNTHLPLPTFFNKTSDDFNTLMADTTKCGKCHYGLDWATDHGAPVQVVPAGNNYCGSGDFTKSGSGAASTCDNVSCHSGQTTPAWD